MNNFFGNRCGCFPFFPPCPPIRPQNNATVTVGSTTTLEAGEPAYVTNTGTLQNAVFNFAIPRGLPGPQGIQGPTGPAGTSGTAATVTVGTTTTLPTGSAATVTNTGTASNAVLNFGIPSGAAGTEGTAATVTVGTVTPLTPGTTPTVTNTGTTSAAVLNFGIPTITPGAAVADLPTTATLADVITAFNSLLTSLETAGVITTS